MSDRDLEAERDFLARSLVDLDREFAAGDIDPADHAALRADYVRRTAEVLRAIEQRRPAAPPPSRPRSPWRRAGVAAFVVVAAVGAGFVVARTAGTRTSSSSLTGDIRASTRQQLLECSELSAASMRGSASTLLDAVRCYDGVLAVQPSDAEALAYRGWLLVRTGDERLAAEGRRNIDAAVAADPTYPDARAFRTIVLYRGGELDAARTELTALEALDPPPLMLQLLDGFGVRQALRG